MKIGLNRYDREFYQSKGWLNKDSEDYLVSEKTKAAKYRSMSKKDSDAYSSERHRRIAFYHSLNAEYAFKFNRVPDSGTKRDNFDVSCVEPMVTYDGKRIRTTSKGYDWFKGDYVGLSPGMKEHYKDDVDVDPDRRPLAKRLFGINRLAGRNINYSGPRPGKGRKK